MKFEAGLSVLLPRKDMSKKKRGAFSWPSISRTSELDKLDTLGGAKRRWFVRTRETVEKTLMALHGLPVIGANLHCPFGSGYQGNHAPGKRDDLEQGPEHDRAWAAYLDQQGFRC